MSEQVFPLSMTNIGEWVKLEKINGGEVLCGRLAALGLTPGTDLCIIQDSGGPLLISVRESRIALGRGVAHKIMVKQRLKI